MSLQPEIEIRTASSPFDDPTADIILRTSNNVDFHVHKLILSKASSLVFEGLLAFPHPPLGSLGVHAGDYKSGIPVASVQDDSAAMDNLLRCWYPNCAPALEKIEDVVALYIIADKYQCEAVLHRSAEALGRFAEKEPLKVYAIACRFGLEREARLAAKCSLSHSFHDLNLFAKSTMTEDLERISALELQRFWCYHNDCQSIAFSLTNVDECHRMWSNEWSPMWRAEPDKDCHCPHGPVCEGWRVSWNDVTEDVKEEHMHYFFTGWFDQYLEDVRESIGSSRSTVFKNLNAKEARDRAAASAASCPACQVDLFSSFSQFTSSFVKKVEDEISKVRLRFEPR